MPDKKRVRHRDIDVRSLARGYTELSVRVLGGIAKDGTSESARVAAASQLLDRGWGKSAQPLTGAAGDDIQVTIRTIIEGKR
jgi:hypothetical protein